MIFNVDVRFEEALAKDAKPARPILVDPTRSLENSSAVQNRLASLRPTSRFVTAQKEASSQAGAHRGRARGGDPGREDPVAARSSARHPSSPAPRTGSTRPATGRSRWPACAATSCCVDFWTYTCINCLRTLPFLEGLYADYHRYGLEIVGVETPEFTFEQEAGNVAQAIRSDGIRYPVVQDNRYGTWNAWQNQYWPAEYLIDAKGKVRHVQFGEGDYKQSEAAVRALLADAGAASLPPPMTANAIMPSAGLGTPETYLDTQRQQGFLAPIQLRRPRTTRAVTRWASTTSRSKGVWGPPGVDHRGRAGASITGSVSRRPRSTWCSPRPGTSRARDASCSTASRCRTPTPAPTSRTASSRSPASGSTR